MKSKRFFSFWGIFLLTCLWIEHIWAAQNITQPIGTLVRTWNITGPIPFPIQPPVPDHFPAPTTPIAELNYICGQWDANAVFETASYDTRYPATEIILTQPQHFVRLLAPGASSNGPWIMRSEYVRGKTPAQLRDIFALPVQPVEIVNVQMPASPDPSTGNSYVLWTGIAGAIKGHGYDWGDGGSVQNRLVSDFGGTNYFSNSTYKYGFTGSATRIHRQPIGEIALSYKPMAGSGNTANIAAYLDTFVPQAYSDLENVYHLLDYLNYVDFGSAPFQNALAQISPEPFGALSFLSFRNAVLFDNALLDGKPIRPGRRQAQYSKINLRLQGIGEFDNKTDERFYSKFRFQSGGIIACVDVQARAHFVWGVGVAGLWNDISWQSSAGKAHGGSAKLGFYASYCPSSFFIDGAICGGADWNTASRNINFYGVSRQARSHPNGEDVELHVQGGKTFLNIATPILRLSYLFNRQNHFDEHGAQSLDLTVKGFNTHTLRTYLGIALDPVYKTAKDIKIIPHLSLAWVDDISLNNRTIRAGLVGPAGTFSVTGMHVEGSYFATGIGCNILLPKHCAIWAKYDAELREHFTAQTVNAGLDVKF